MQNTQVQSRIVSGHTFKFRVRPAQGDGGVDLGFDSVVEVECYTQRYSPIPAQWFEAVWGSFAGMDLNEVWARARYQIIGTWCHNEGIGRETALDIGGYR